MAETTLFDIWLNSPIGTKVYASSSNGSVSGADLQYFNDKYDVVMSAKANSRHIPTIVNNIIDYYNPRDNSYEWGFFFFACSDVRITKITFDIYIGSYGYDGCAGYFGAHYCDGNGNFTTITDKLIAPSGTQHQGSADYVINGNAWNTIEINLPESNVNYIKIGGWWGDYQFANIKLETVPTYTWQSVAGVSGASGSFPLPVIKPEAINNGEPVSNVTSDAFSSLPSNAYIPNFLGGADERWFIVTGDTENTPPDWFTRAFLMYFYSPTRIDIDFTGYEEDIGSFSVGTNVLTSAKPYLSILVDDENEVAKFSIIYDNGNNSYSYNGETLTDEQMHNLWIWLQGNYSTSQEINEENTETGSWTPPTAEIIGLPTTPAIDALDTGFTSMYRVENTELQKLSQFMWSQSWTDIVNKFFDDPSEIIVGLMMFPVKPPTQSSDQIMIAGGITTTAKGYKITDQYDDITIGKRVCAFSGDGGKGNFLDYSPYTRVSVVLPYCGEHSLNPSDVMGKELELHYVVDFLTGACMAYILVDGSCHYAFAGQMGVQIPISKSSFNEMISSILATGATIGGTMATLATGGLTAPMAGIGASVIGNVMNMHPNVSFTSGGGGVSGWIGNQEPYIRIEQPIPKEGDGQNLYVGLPTYMTKKLETCYGYTKVIEAHLENMTCTQAEQDEILSLLRSGVIIHTGSEKPEVTPTVSGDTVLTFIKMESETNVIGKTWDETNNLNIEGHLIYDTSLTNPKFYISGDVRGYNYVYIPLFDRFYYINNITLKENNLEIIDMKVDVLQSFKDEILNNNALIERQKTKTNKFFQDSLLWTQQNTKIIPLHFLGGDYSRSMFTRNDNCYVLTLAGS